MALIPVHRRVVRFWPAFFGGIFLFCAFAAVVIIAYKASMPAKTVEDDRADARKQKLAALRADDDVKLHQYKWANKAKGTVQIPIDRAMDLVLLDLQAKKPHPTSVKVENPYPNGLEDVTAPAPIVSGSNAAPASATSPAASVPTPAPAARAAPTPAPAPVAVATPIPPSLSPARSPIWNWQSPAPASGGAPAPSPK